MLASNVIIELLLWLLTSAAVQILRRLAESLLSAPKTSVDNNFTKAITGTNADVLRHVVLFLHFILVLECMMTTIELCSSLTAIYNNESHLNTKSRSGNMLEAPAVQRLRILENTTTLLHHRLRWPDKCYKNDSAHSPQQIAVAENIFIWLIKSCIHWPQQTVAAFLQRKLVYMITSFSAMASNGHLTTTTTLRNCIKRNWNYSTDMIIDEIRKNMNMNYESYLQLNLTAISI